MTPKEQSRIIYLSDFASKRPHPSPTSVESVGLNEKKREELHKAIAILHTNSDSPYEFLHNSAVLAVSVIQACMDAGFSNAPWYFADLYERMMRNGQAEE